MNPDVSCIIPSFNGIERLSAAVQSALTQQGVNVEVVIVDDYSNIETRNFILELARHDERIRPFLLPENGGQSVARNIGAMIARAPFITFLDQDDEHCEGWYEAAVEVFRLQPQLGALSGHARVLDIPARFGIDETDLRIRGLSLVFMTNVVCRRSVFLNSGGFPTAAIWRSPIAGEDGVYRAALMHYWNGATCEFPALKHWAKEGGTTVGFLERSKVVDNKVHIEANELERSGAIQAATHLFLADVARIAKECQACAVHQG
ncbi:glycosyltransferase family 2 protein [Collimonas pratensis]|uniref:Glycosyl transferase 2 family protein n=1 Tax=Collimonas pratensis TaxID=279113 RepID=A0ABN4MBJ7_9BURK|nr:glycosyltransferase family A protein [Collimonas pratensis]AMP15600.1 glycosyl transferase 2 family protein [Collimonas pratensis]